MVPKLLITLVCYMPILESILPGTNFGPGIPDIGPVLLCTYLLMLAFTVQVAATRTVTLGNRWIAILAVFCLIVIASVSWSRYSFSGVIVQEIFGNVLTPLFVTIVAINVFQERKNARFYVKHIIISAFILSLLSTIQMTGGLLAGQHSIEALRSAGTLGNPNLLAIFLVLTIPCMLYALDTNLLSRQLLVIFLIFAVAGVLTTVSRKGIFTLMLSFLIFDLIRKRYRRIAITFILFSILAITFSQWSLFMERFGRDTVQGDVEGKWAMTVAGGKMFFRSPIRGFGYKGYYENFGAYFPESWKKKYDAHNIFITSLANYGLIGFIPFLSLFLYPLFSALHVLRGTTGLATSEHLRHMAVICVVSVIPYMLSGWFAGGLTYEPVISSLLYTNLALFLAPYYREVT